MRPLEVIPIVADEVPDPATHLPRDLIWLALEHDRPAPSWDELRSWLMLDKAISFHEAEALILEAITAGDAEARLTFEGTWTVRVSSRAARAVLLIYALQRLEGAGLRMEDADLYDEHDRLLVLAMLPELDAFADDRTPNPRPAIYRRLLKGSGHA